MKGFKFLPAKDVEDAGRFVTHVAHETIRMYVRREKEKMTLLRKIIGKPAQVTIEQEGHFPQCCKVVTEDHTGYWEMGGARRYSLPVLRRKQLDIKIIHRDFPERRRVGDVI